MHYSTIVKTATLLVFGLLLISATSALADANTEQLVIKVSYADLNLNSDEGLRRLNSRLKRAARDACNYRSLREAGTLRVAQQSAECVTAALRGAYEQLDSDLLARIDDPDVARIMRSGDSDS
jgi:UrcA family protein